LRVVNFGSLIDQPVAPASLVTIFGDSIGPSTVNLCNSARTANSQLCWTAGRSSSTALLPR
jgi:hypothetical protein